MNLTLDIGNTRSKAALFAGNQLLETTEFNPKSVDDDIKSFIDLHPEIKNIIFSTVGSQLQTLVPSTWPGILITLDENTSLPIQNKYNTRETLGSDRISNAVGAAFLFPKKNVLVIDAGTCITLDMVDNAGNYLGGSISGGLKMRFQALNTFTENLPLVAHDNTVYPDLIGRSTNESIRSGVINGIIAELCGMIDAYNNQFNPLTILITGGDSTFIEQGLRNLVDIKKNEIFANPNLVHIGLNAILNFYVKSKLP